MNTAVTNSEESSVVVWQALDLLPSGKVKDRIPRVAPLLFLTASVSGWQLHRSGFSNRVIFTLPPGQN